MRDKDQRTFVRRQRDSQRLSSFDIQMIGRLIEQQQVGALPGDQRKCATRLLAARHRANQRSGEFTGKSVLTEKLSELLLACFWREPAQVLQRRLIGAQLIELVLREVADCESGSSPQLSCLRSKIAGD